MSLYRQVGGGARRAMIVAAAALLVGLAGGFALGRASEEEPTLASAVTQVQDDVQPVLSALELVEIEYPQGVRSGKVIAKSEHEAAQADVARARESFAGVRSDLDVLDPQEAAEADLLLGRLARLIDATGSNDEVRSVARAAAEAVRRAGRLQPES